MNAINIKRIRVRDLHAFARQAYEEAGRDGMLPITKERALAQSYNPCAGEEDIGLLVAYLGTQCVGYLGIMPGLLKKENEFSKIYWLSTWYVPPEFRKKAIGLALLREAFSLDYDIVLTGITEDAEKIYRVMKFQEISKLLYYEMNLASADPVSRLIRLTQKALKKTGIELKFLDAAARNAAHLLLPVIKSALYPIMLRRRMEDLGEIRYIESGEIDYDERDRPPVEFHRGRDIINWMLQYRWILERGETGARHLNYHFSGLRDMFKYIALKIHSSSDGAYKGFMILSVSSEDNKCILKTLDLHFRERSDYRYAASLVIQYAKRYLADYVELPDILYPYLKEDPIARILSYRKERVYLFRPKDENSKLAASIKEAVLNYCDGDMAFV